MNLTKLSRDQRGAMVHADFRGYPLFSNGAKGTVRPDGFGAIQVFNDDYLFAGTYVGMHPHANVEVITVMLSGAETHQDSLGYQQDLPAGSVQLISSGSGIRHAGGNRSATAEAHHLQIWVAPRDRNTPPSVQLKQPPAELPPNQWLSQISPDGSRGSLTVKQDVWLQQGVFEKGPVRYQLHKKGHGVMLYVLSGDVKIGDVRVGAEDALFVTEADSLDLLIDQAASLVLMETAL